MKLVDIYTLLIALFGLFVLVLPFTGSVFDNRRKWYKKLLLRGWLVIIAFIAGVCFTIFKDNEVEEANSLQKQRDKKEYQKSLNESLANSQNALGKTLARYYLKYNQAQLDLEQIVKDSSKTNIIKQKDSPQLEVINVKAGIINDSLNIATSFKAVGSTIKNTKLNLLYVFRATDEQLNEKTLTFVKPPKNPLTLNNPIIAGGFNEKEVSISFTKPIETVFPQIIYIYGFGTFENEDSKKFKFSFLHFYNLKKKIFGDPLLDEYILIKQFINKNSRKNKI